MATSTSEFRNLVSNYKTITAASRAANNADPAIRGQLTGLQAQLAPYVAEGYTAGGYDDAATINKDITDYINLIDKNIANGVTKDKEADPAAKKAEENKTEQKSEGDNKAPDDKVIEPKPNKVATSSSSAPSELGKRTWNPLGDFSSYTYRASLYAMPPEALNTYKETGRFDNKDLFLIVQSGGANIGGATSDASGNMTTMDATRGAGFELDFYIDDLQIDTLTNAKETGISSNSVDFKFKIIEPYGMTFPTKLVAQQIELQSIANMSRPVSEQIEALAGHYLLSIRFYGYDENGQLVSSSMYGGSAKDGATAALLDSSATFERSFPILINKFQFRIDGKSTVYDLNAKLVAEQVALGAKRGIVPAALSISGATVGEMIGGSGGKNGLLDQLNSLQQGLKDPPKSSQELADEYEIVYENNRIKDSSVIDDSQINKNRVPLADVSLGGTVKTSISAGSKTMAKSRTMKFEAGLPLTQAIDQIITQSKYISDALKYQSSEEAQPVIEGEGNTDENAKPKTFQWYIVAPSISVLGWDKLRNDFAYKITYVIKSYEIPYVKAVNVANVPKYPGPHKIYNYWYTGKNSEVLSYEQNYNLLYFNAAALADEKSPVDLKSKTPLYQRAAQGADSTGKSSGSFDAVNSVKTFLYSPGDQLHAKIKILGDPDFLMPATSGSPQEILKQWYGDDFTINPNSGQVFIELIFNQVEDYSHVDGTLTPNDRIDFWDYSDNPNMASMVKGMVYMVTKVTSRFSRGMFTQEFKTILPNFDKDTATAKPTASIQRSETKPKPAGAGRGIQGGPTAAQATAGAGAGRGSIGGATAEQAAQNKGLENQSQLQNLQKIKQSVRMGSTVNDDQLIAPVGTYANAGREKVESPLLKKTDPSRSIMFKK